MVLLTRIYTRGGDKGKTSLGTGKRVLKSSPRIAAIGDVDEANASIGIARLHAAGDIDLLLFRIQNDLFDIGADLCIPEDKENKVRLRLHSHQVAFLEKSIDLYNKSLPPLNSFVLPGGTSLSAHLHQARTIVRRAERTICILRDREPVNEIIIHYINRLSDFLFVLARYDNHQKEGDILWVPGLNR
ncbi:MAG TPA: cob(I)yrinic acid a,c-diamide adenosyltransferase [Alphaproteobacteria bacterium]|nr:cob(I)yrinic acid a,c-diamide adenosyltransferase [Alphaproteobacteria bacterium]